MPADTMAYNYITKEEANYGYNYRNGNYPRALEWYQKYLNTMTPQNYTSVMYYNLGELYEKTNQELEAVNQYIKALQICPLPKDENGYINYTEFNKLFTAIRNLTTKNKWDDQYLKALNIAADRNPQDRNVFDLLSYYYIEKGQLETALQMAKKMLDIAPNSIDGFNRLAIVYYLQGDYTKAQAAIDKALSIDPTNLLAKIYHSYMPFEKGDFQATVDELNSVTPLVDNKMLKYRSYVKLALSDLFLDKPDAALKAATEAYNVRVNRSSGLVLDQRKEYPEVVDIWSGSTAEKAGILKGDTIESVDSIDLKGKSLDQIQNLFVGKIDSPMVLGVRINSLPPKKPQTGIFIIDAINESARNKNYKKLMSITVNRGEYAQSYSTDVTGLMALINRELGNKQDFDNHADAAYTLYNFLITKGKNPLEINSNKIVYNHFLAQYPMALKYIDNGNYNGALDLLDKITSIQGQYKDFIPLVTLQKALIYYKLGKNDEAISILSELGIDEHNQKNLYLTKEYKRILKDFEPLKQQIQAQEREQESKKEYKDALDSLKKLVALSETKEEQDLLRQKMFYFGKNITLGQEDMNNIHKYTLRAELLLKEKDYTGALTEYKKVLKIAPFMTGIYYNIALVMGELERYKDAINYMNTYISAEETNPDLQQAKDEIIKWELKLEKAN